MRLCGDGDKIKETSAQNAFRPALAKIKLHCRFIMAYPVRNNH